MPDTPPYVGKPKRAKPDEGATTPRIGTAEHDRHDHLLAVPHDVRARIDRGEQAMRPFEPGWQECLAFLDNDQYVEVFADGRLDRLQTREGGSKPRHRPRLTRNRFTPAIMREASMVSARVPVYEATAGNGDMATTNAAIMAEKGLLALYTHLDVKGLAIDTAQYSLTVGAGFTWPYWNSDVGDFLVGDAGVIAREGEIGVHVLHQGEVLWQPGTDFYDARWHVVRKAQPIEEVAARAGCRPDHLTADAMSAPHEARRGEEARDLVFVYHYLERPSNDHPHGRWMQMANGKLIADTRPYPRKGDECALQWIPWMKRRHRDRPMGMGELMLDIQRTYNRTINQIVAYKNLVLSPQVFAPVGSLRQQLDDTPGAVIQFRPIAGMRPEWREMPDLPVGLFRVLDQCISDFEEITGQRGLPDGVESGAGVQARNEREQAQRATFVARVADWYSRLGMAMIELMQKHYTEDRLLEVQGRFGVERIEDFRGAKLRGVTSIRVAPGSIEPRTRAAQQAIIIQLIDRGLADPKKAMAALNAGTADALIDAYELDKAKQHREIKQLVAMGRMQGPGVPMVDETVDDHGVHLDELRMWMKTVDYERQPDMVKAAAQTHAQWHEQAQAGQALQQLQAMTGAAEQAGMENAAAPQGPGGGAPAGPGEGGSEVAPPGSKPMPSKPSTESSLRAAQGTPKVS